jgi:hypothetical protein
LDATVMGLCTPIVEGTRPVGGACSADDECEARVCQDGQCTEVCNDDGDCLTGQVCTSMVRAGTGGQTYVGCGFTARSAAVQVDEFDLGEHDIPIGRTSSVDITIPSDAVSVTFLGKRVGGDPISLAFSNITDPSDAVVFDLGEIFELRDQPLRWIPADTGEIVAALLPNASPERLVLRPGRHRWSVGALRRTSTETGTVRVRLLARVKRAAERPVSSGALSLDVHLVGVGLTADTAPADARLQGAIAHFSRVLGAVGLRVGDVAYHVIDDDRLAVIDSTSGESSELATLFRTSAPRSGLRVSLFLVRSIRASSSGAQTLGIAGGIPGPAGEHGTQHSGVVIAFDPSVMGTGIEGSQRIGHVMAHELSHFLGLFHVTERDPPCEPGQTSGCAPFGGTDTIADTTLGDTTNLMNWSIVGAGTNDRVSAGQGQVLRGSALVGP